MKVNTFKKLVGAAILSVVIFSGCGSSGNGNSVGGNENGVLGIPTDLTATPTSSSSITICWLSVPDADGYYVYRSMTSNGAYTQVGSTNSSLDTSYTDTELLPNTTYYYRVAAYNNEGTGVRSSAVDATTLTEEEDEGMCGYIRHGDLQCNIHNRSECEYLDGIFWGYGFFDINSVENDDIRYLCADPNVFCDPSSPSITLVPYPDTIGLNQPNVFMNMMGRGPPMGSGAFMHNWDDGAIDKVDVVADIRIYPADVDGNKTSTVPLVLNAYDPMSVLDVGRKYVIEHTVRRPTNCNIGIPGHVTVSRVITVVQMTIVPTTPPTIMLEGPPSTTVTLGETYNDGGLSHVADASDFGGEPILHLDNIVIKHGLTTIVNSGRIMVLEAATWVTNMFANMALTMELQTFTITYHVTSPITGISASVTRTVTVQAVP